MFSTTLLDKEFSRSFALIRNIATDKVETVLFSTPKLRKLKDKHSPDDFKKSIKKYCSSIEDGTFVLKPNYLFESVPNVNPSRLNREISTIFGQSGSGKSYFIAQQMRKYQEAFPKSNMYYISPNEMENDASLGPLKKKFKVREIDVAKLESPINIYDKELYKQSLIVYDDTDSNSFNYDLESLDENLTEETLAGMSLTQKNKMIIEGNKRLKMGIDFANKTLKKIVWEGRKQNISLFYVYHDMFQGTQENMLISESTKIVLFPYKITISRLRNFLKEKLGLAKSDIEWVINHEYYLYDFLIVDKTEKSFILTPDVLKLLN